MGLKDLSDSDLNNMMDDLDSDKNGVIDKDEFQLWWMSGRKGTSASTTKLILAKFGGKPFLDSLSATGKQLA
jgi:hypothetical protein